jgi:hypothetical protein
MRTAWNSIGGVLLLTAIILSAAAALHGQSPTTQPRISASGMHYLGSFRVPDSDGSGDAGRLTYGGAALGLSPGGGLYIVGHDQTHPGRVFEISIPAIGGTATIRQRGADPTEGRQGQIDDGDVKVGGTLAWNGRLITSYYSYYDGDENTTLSHVASGTNFGTTGDVSGPVKVGTAGAGFVGGYMTTIPSEWQGLLGGPALTGACCLAIVNRTSWGPAVSVFNPDDIGRRNPVPATELIGYPYTHPLSQWRSDSTLYNGTTEIAGVAFPAGTRSVLFIGKQGTGAFCYDEPSAPCNDPASPYKGVHGYPYVHQVWAYDANDLLAVKQGTRQPWDVRPYATWTLREMNASGSASIAGAAYDPRTRRLYVTEHYGATPRVHVYEISTASAEDPSGPPPSGPPPSGPPPSGPPPQGPPPPPSPEVCGDGVDNDRDGTVDEGCQPQGLGAILPPLAPSNLLRTLVGRVATFGWLAPIAGDAVTGFVADVGRAPGQTTYRFPVGTATGVRVPDVPDGKYFVRIRGFNAAGLGPPSNEVVVNTRCVAAPGQPRWLSSLTNGPVVSLSWLDADGCADTYYRMVVGSQPGAANLANIPIDVGSLLAAAQPGTYYTRVQAVSRLGASAPSAERQVVIGPAACTPPVFPTTLRGAVSGRTVMLRWGPGQLAAALASDATVPLWYNLEVGTAPGLSNIAVFPMGRTTAFSAVAPPGAYYARIRAINVCGAGAASNDFFVRVN